MNLSCNIAAASYVPIFAHLFVALGVNSEAATRRQLWDLGAPPERNHVAQLGGQAAELIGRQVQVDQVGQLGDVGRDSGEVVVVDVQCRQVGEGP